MRKDSFFALPLELRIVVYEHYFSYEKPHQARTSSSPLSLKTQATPQIAPPSNPGPKRNFKCILARKFPLLWSSRAILTEALPVFYRCHVFRVHVPYWNRSEIWHAPGWDYRCTRTGPRKRARSMKLQQIDTLAPAGRFVTKLAIIEVAWVDKAWDPQQRSSSIPGFQHLLREFPNLRFLRINVDAMYHAINIHKPRNTGVVTEIWQRHLECLEVGLLHFGEEGSLFREAIAPESCWVMEMPPVQVSREGLLRSVWSIRRSNLPKDGLARLGGRVEEIV